MAFVPVHAPVEQSEDKARRLDGSFFQAMVVGGAIGMIVGAIVLGGLIYAAAGAGDSWAVLGVGALVGAFFGLFFGSWSGIVVFDAKHDGEG